MNGSKDKLGRVGAGWYGEGGAAEGFVGLGKVATVWGGEVAGVRKALDAVDRSKKVLILSDSQAAIAVVKKAGRLGKARTRDLRKVIQHTRWRQEELGLGAVRFGWVKSHIGIHGDEKADEQAKLGAQDYTQTSPILQKGASSRSGKRGGRRRGR